MGSSYQADIPESLASYDDAPPYENEDTIQWEPGKVDDQTIVDFYDKWYVVTASIVDNNNNNDNNKNKNDKNNNNNSNHRVEYTIYLICRI